MKSTTIAVLVTLLLVAGSALAFVSAAVSWEAWEVPTASRADRYDTPTHERCRVETPERVVSGWVWIIDGRPHCYNAFTSTAVALP